MTQVGAVPFSRTTHRLASELAEVSVSRYPAAMRQSRHGHDAAYFTVVLTGAYDEQVGRSSDDVRGGRMLFHPSGEEHAVAFRAPTRIVRLLPKPSMLQAAALLRVDLSAPLPRLAAARGLLARLVDVVATDSVDAPLLVDGLASELVAVLAHDEGDCRSRARSSVAEHARALVDASPTTVHSLADLARTVGCHPITLARTFRRAHGCSLGTYARRARLRAACAMLERREMSISMVAAHCGFADQAHLTRALRRATGRTPGAIVSAAR